MEATLVAVTLVSLALAGAMAVVTWRLLQEQRRRGEARIAALAADLAAPDPAAEVQTPVGSPHNSRFDAERARTPAVTPVADAGARVRPGEPEAAAAASVLRASSGGGKVERSMVTPLTSARQEGPALFAYDASRRQHAAPRPRPDRVPDIAPKPRRADAGDVVIDRGAPLFETATGPVPSLFHRLAPALIVLVALTGTGLALASAGLFDSFGAASARPAASSPPPLELLSLTHARNGDTVTITGLVRNPPSGRRIERLTAIAFVFDAEGGFVASARAPLDFTVLSPGDESPFQLTLKPSAPVARYRVSFRLDDAGLVPHVDRREQAAGSRVSPAPATRRSS